MSSSRGTKRKASPLLSILAITLGSLPVVLILVGMAAAHFGWSAPIQGFKIFRIGGEIAIGLTLATGLLALLKGSKAMHPAMLPSLLIAVAFITMGLRGKHHPVINDVTTDTENPPEFVRAATLPANQGVDLRYPRSRFEALQKQGYPDLGPAIMNVPKEDAFTFMELAANQMQGWEITRVDRDALQIEAVATSKLFRFQDDIVMEVRRHDRSNGGAEIHMRSRSRVGKGDFGANARRIRVFLSRLKR
ncbi:MAG: DUF1499 domain-containing protein [Bdellovibrionota bacterium]